MAMTIHVDIVSAEEQIFSGLAEFVALPGEAGELGILPGHMPLMTRIKPGAVRVKVQNQTEEELVFVAGGLLVSESQCFVKLLNSMLKVDDVNAVTSTKDVLVHFWVPKTSLVTKVSTCFKQSTHRN